ncbi:MAG: prepilin-type N-terminal cleavage/methylation domain-containing protein [Luteimonas sp.]
MKQRGFTLIEVLLATALLAAGLAIAFATLRAATATVQRGEALSQRNERIRAVSGFLRSRLSAARPVPFAMDDTGGIAYRFRGDGAHLEFVADLPDYLGRGGPYLHRLEVERAEGGTLRLVVSFRMVQGGAVVGDGRSDAMAPEVLADGLRAVDIRYRGLRADGKPSEWQADWNQGDAMPLQVELRLRDADGRAWPPLLVALPLAGRYAQQLEGM